MLVTQSTIDEAVKRLVEAYNPLKIYLHGDYAWGTPNFVKNKVSYKI